MSFEDFNESAENARYGGFALHKMPKTEQEMSMVDFNVDVRSNMNCFNAHLVSIIH